jgi:hypothetical protein
MYCMAHKSRQEDTDGPAMHVRYASKVCRVRRHLAGGTAAATNRSSDPIGSSIRQSGDPKHTAKSTKPAEAADLAYAQKLQADEKDLLAREQAERTAEERAAVREAQAARRRRRKPAAAAAAAPAKRARRAEPAEMMTCSICLDGLDEGLTVTAPCGHHFHRDCLMSWLGEAPSCPLCKRHISARRLK